MQIILVAGSYVLVSKADALDDAESDSPSTESKTQVGYALMVYQV